MQPLCSVSLWSAVVANVGPAIAATSQNSPREGKPIGTLFTYESETPQKVKTECQVFKYGTWTFTITEWVQAVKKFISTRGFTKVAVSEPALFPGALRHAIVYLHDFCFRVEIGSTSFGQVVGWTEPFVKE